MHQRRSQHPLLKLLDTAPRDLAVLAIRMLQVRSKSKVLQVLPDPHLCARRRHSACRVERLVCLLIIRFVLAMLFDICDVCSYGLRASKTQVDPVRRVSAAAALQHPFFAAE